MSPPLLCLVTGASGYIGGRLVPELLDAGYSVRCMARDPGKLSDRPWSGRVEVAEADVMDRAAVRDALEGVDVAYYLIHSLGTGASFEQRDRDAAATFAQAAGKEYQPVSPPMPSMTRHKAAGGARTTLIRAST
jgi:uncharacterized protein YbjT (DUF2867 family)